MSVIPTFERTLARRCDASVKSLLRGLFRTPEQEKHSQPSPIHEQRGAI